MPVVCINRPNRSKPREFTVADLERIARIVGQDSGISPWAILGAVAVGLGIGALLCKLADIARNLEVIRTFFLDVGVTAAGLLALQITVRAMTGAVAVFGRFNIALAAITAILILVERILERLESVLGDAVFAAKAIAGINIACDAVFDAVEMAIDKGRSLTDDDRAIVETPRFNI